MSGRACTREHGTVSGKPSISLLLVLGCFGFTACAGSAAPAAAGKSRPASPGTKPAAAVPPFLEITEWRYRDGAEPSAIAPGFDDSKWEAIKDAATGRGKGGISYGWYRTTVQIPEKIGGVPVAGKPLQLSIL